MVKVHHCKFFFFFLPFWLCVCHLTLLFFLLFFLAPLFCGNFGMKLVVKLRNWSHDWRLWVDVGGCLIREISFYLILYIQWRELADYRIVALDIAATWEHFLAVSLMSSDRLTWHRTPFIPHSLIFFISNFFLVCYLTVKTKYLLDLKNSSSVHPCYAIKRLCMCSWKPLHLLAWEQYNTRSKSKYMIILFLI